MLNSQNDGSCGQLPGVNMCNWINVKHGIAQNAKSTIRAVNEGQD